MRGFSSQYVRLGLFVFVYTAAVAAMIQFILLPRVFQAWHAGHGLIAGGDMPGHHALAMAQAQRIRDAGWSAWTLRPGGQAPAGIASALYVLLASEPWTMIPLHAALHALAGVLVFAMLRRFRPVGKTAMLAVGPLVLFPSAALWYSQLGKDGFSIAGYLAIITGWLFLIELPEAAGPKHFGLVLGLFLVGLGLVWVVRPYALELIWVFSGPVALGTIGALIRRGARLGLSWTKVSAGSAIAITMFSALCFLSTGGYEPEAPPSSAPITETAPTPVIGDDEADQALIPGDTTYVGTVVWKRTTWLPSFIDDRLYSLAVARTGFTNLFPLAASNIDEQIGFGNAADVVAYLPRAAAIGLVYPTPPQWFGEGSLPQNTVMRRISGFEMTVAYLGLLLLPYAMWRWRTRLALWLLLVFNLGMLIAHALVVANLGTLYRLRYPYFMSLVSLGLLSGMAWYFDRRNAKTSVFSQPGEA